MGVEGQPLLMGILLDSIRINPWQQHPSNKSSYL
jgi:hypothetical protein